jgi:hypothetical protein
MVSWSAATLKPSTAWTARVHVWPRRVRSYRTWVPRAGRPQCSALWALRHHCQAGPSVRTAFDATRRRTARTGRRSRTQGLLRVPERDQRSVSARQVAVPGIGRGSLCAPPRLRRTRSDAGVVVCDIARRAQIQQRQPNSWPYLPPRLRDPHAPPPEELGERIVEGRVLEGRTLPP